MRHLSVWNDRYVLVMLLFAIELTCGESYSTYPNEPPLASYPEGFQGTAIPVHGPTVAKLIEDRLEGKLKFRRVSPS
jgi:hypothetical protein